MFDLDEYEVAKKAKNSTPTSISADSNVKYWKLVVAENPIENRTISQNSTKKAPENTQIKKMPRFRFQPWIDSAQEVAESKNI